MRYMLNKKDWLGLRASKKSRARKKKLRRGTLHCKLSGNHLQTVITKRKT
ncbi:hypothetical protein ANCCAN_26472 [Ancylostoma caninum]|uniref:Uncharacterized protein n=1 Tax=Ancylostoma caninum TaxID=29170 RepID=A0A368F6U7_ANCCA|nr:hypothetical protein ANCCAN_26472 [Ancylostoma caninum]